MTEGGHTRLCGIHGRERRHVIQTAGSKRADANRCAGRVGHKAHGTNSIEGTVKLNDFPVPSMRLPPHHRLCWPIIGASLWGDSRARPLGPDEPGALAGLCRADAAQYRSKPAKQASGGPVARFLGAGRYSHTPAFELDVCGHRDPLEPASWGHRPQGSKVYC